MRRSSTFPFALPPFYLYNIIGYLISLPLCPDASVDSYSKFLSSPGRFSGLANMLKLGTMLAWLLLLLNSPPLKQLMYLFLPYPPPWWASPFLEFPSSSIQKGIVFYFELQQGILFSVIWWSTLIFFFVILTSFGFAAVLGELFFINFWGVVFVAGTTFSD